MPAVGTVPLHFSLCFYREESHLSHEHLAALGMFLGLLLSTHSHVWRISNLIASQAEYQTSLPHRLKIFSFALAAYAIQTSMLVWYGTILCARK